MGFPDAFSQTASFQAESLSCFQVPSIILALYPHWKYLVALYKFNAKDRLVFRLLATQGMSLHSCWNVCFLRGSYVGTKRQQWKS